METVGAFLTSWRDAFASVQSISTVVAVIIAGVWAYYKIFAGKLYYKRLELSVSGLLFDTRAAHLVLAKLCIRNVGLSRVFLEPGLSTLEVSEYVLENYESIFHSAVWDESKAISVFEDHEFIEPGEVIYEERLLGLPVGSLLALKLGLRVLSRRRKLAPGTRQMEWNAISIIEAKPVPGLAAADL